MSRLKILHRFIRIKNESRTRRWALLGRRVHHLSRREGPWSRLPPPPALLGPLCHRCSRTMAQLRRAHSGTTHVPARGARPGMTCAAARGEPVRLRPAPLGGAGPSVTHSATRETSSGRDPRRRSGEPVRPSLAAAMGEERAGASLPWARSG